MELRLKALGVRDVWAMETKTMFFGVDRSLLRQVDKGRNVQHRTVEVDRK